MDVKRYTYYFLLLLVLNMMQKAVFAQSVEVITDKTQILIGERIEYNMLVKLPSKDYSIKFTMPENLPHFEVLEKGEFDTVSNNGALTLRRKFLLTSFDSGSWYIPSLPVTFMFNSRPLNFPTDSVLINVGYATADSSGTLRDIKPIMEVFVKNYFWYYVVSAILLALFIAYFVYRYLQARKLRPVPVLHADLSAYDEAMKSLGELKKYNLAQPADIKLFHSTLASIIKRFYSRKTDQVLLNRTTGDLLLKFREQDVSAAVIASIAAALRTGDAVKFAKYLPPANESDNCLELVKNGIEKLNSNSN